MAHIVFCFPYKSVGGVSVLFARLAEAIVRQGPHRVSIVDYADGYLTKISKSPEINRIEYRDDVPVQMPPDAIVVLQSLLPWSIFPMLRFADSTRIFFWNCHPFNLVPTMPGTRKLTLSDARAGRFMLATILRGYKKTILKLIALLNEKKALAFMDDANIENTVEYLRIALPSPNYIPLLIGTEAAPPRHNGRNWARDGMRLGWIGRVVDFKYHVLLRTLLELDRAQPALGFPISFDVIGAGEMLEPLKQAAATLSNVTINFIDYIPIETMSSYLRNYIDVLFAMGSVALEGMSVSTPTVLLDVSYRPVPQSYVFTWGHERKGYTLGKVLRPSDLRPGNTSLFDCLKAAAASYDAVSQATAAYYAAAFSPQTTLDAFLKYVTASNCTFADYRVAGMTKRSPLARIYSWLRYRR